MKAIVVDTAKVKGLCPFKEGEIVTVKQCPVYKNNYDVLEYPIDPDTGRLCSYDKCYFILLSDIDETEFIRNYKTQPA